MKPMTITNQVKSKAFFPLKSAQWAVKWKIKKGKVIQEEDVACTAKEKMNVCQDWQVFNPIKAENVRNKPPPKRVLAG